MYSFFTYLQQQMRDREEEEREQICLASENLPVWTVQPGVQPILLQLPPRKAPQGDPPRARGAVRPEHHPL